MQVFSPLSQTVVRLYPMANATSIPKIIPGAEPFFFPGDAVKAGARIGCLVMHGLNASPQEVFWLGRHLGAQGAMVYGARLYGHGIDVELLNRARWQDWYASALDGYTLLRQHCDQVFVMGLSLGGLISLLLAANQPVGGVIVLAGALRLRSDARIAHLLRYTGMTILKFDREKDVIHKRVTQMQRDAGEPITGRVSYYAHKAAGLSELLRLQAVVDGSLSKITAPAMLVYSEGDTVIPFDVMAELQRKMTGSRAVQTLPLRDSEHILTNDVDMDRVFEGAWSFIQQTVQANLSGK